MMATMSVGVAASGLVFTADQNNAVMLNLGANADSVTFTGEDEASDELGVNGLDGILTPNADYLDGVARVGVHSEAGAENYDVYGTGPEGWLLC